MEDAETERRRVVGQENHERTPMSCCSNTRIPSPFSVLDACIFVINRYVFESACCSAGERPLVSSCVYLSILGMSVLFNHITLTTTAVTVFYARSCDKHRSIIPISACAKKISYRRLMSSHDKDIDNGMQSSISHKCDTQRRYRGYSVRIHGHTKHCGAYDLSVNIPQKLANDNGHRDVLPLVFLVRELFFMISCCPFRLLTSFVGGVDSEVDVLCESAPGFDGVVGTVYRRRQSRPSEPHNF